MHGPGRVLPGVQRDGTTTRLERPERTEQLPDGAQTGDGPADEACEAPSAPLPPPPSAPGVSHRLRTLGVALLTGHLLVLGWLLLRPLSVGWTSPANLTPFASVDQAVALGGLAGAWQLASGLLPLAPLGVLLPLAGGQLRAAWLPSFLRTVGGSALLATALEFLKGWAPGHVLNVDNILLGTLGVALCHLALVPLMRARLLRERPPGEGGRAGAAYPGSYGPTAPASPERSISGTPLRAALRSPYAAPVRVQGPDRLRG